MALLYKVRQPSELGLNFILKCDLPGGRERLIFWVELCQRGWFYKMRDFLYNLETWIFYIIWRHLICKLQAACGGK